MPRPNTVTLVADSDTTEVVLPSTVGDVSADYDDTLQIGSVLGDYVIDAVVGRGGGGVVYAAHPLAGGISVAIKVLRAEMACYPAMITRFLREAEAVQQIRHANIIEIHQIAELAPRRPYYVMELLNGVDLRKLLQTHGRFSPADVFALMQPICGAVEAAHRAGIIHRDIKANNVVVVDRVLESGESMRVVKLLDFGIAKMLQADNAGQGLTEPGAMLGTAHNMAPEQVRCDRLDTRVDIYALGVLIYQLLTGQFPFHASDPRQVALMHLQTPAPRPSALAPVSPALDAVVLKCLEKRPENRFASVADLLHALQSAVGDQGAASADVARPAVGVYLELTVTGDDEDAFEDMCNVLDSAEQLLSNAGFAFPLKTSTALLGVRVLGQAAELDRASAELAYSALRSELAQRNGRSPSLSLRLVLKHGEVQCRATGATPEPSLMGGALLDVGSFADAPNDGQGL